MQIVSYDKKYEADFKRLNYGWLDRFFEREEADKEVLENVDKYVGGGSLIYFALDGDVVVATCMVMPYGDGEWEIMKLATDPDFGGKGAGSAVFKACMDACIERGAKKIKIISNTRLKPALHIYEKFGFKEVPLDDELHGYARADIQFEYIV